MNKLALGTFLLASCAAVPQEQQHTTPHRPQISTTCPSGYQMVKGEQNNPMSRFPISNENTSSEACLSNENGDFDAFKRECSKNGGFVKVESIMGGTRTDLWLRLWKCTADHVPNKSNQ